MSLLLISSVNYLHITPEYDKKIEEVVQPFFESYYSIEFSNYAVDDSYLHDHEIIATGKA